MHFSAMVISVHRITYQEYYYTVSSLPGKYLFTLFKSAHCWRFTDKWDVEKPWLWSSHWECSWNRILPIKHFIQHQHTKKLTLWLCFKKYRSSNKLFCVPGTKPHLQKVIICLCSGAFWSGDRVQHFRPSAWE